MASNTVSDNSSAILDSQITHDSSQPTDLIFNHRALHLPLTSHAGSWSGGEPPTLHLMHGTQEASPFGSFLPGTPRNSRPSLDLVRQRATNSLSQGQIHDLLEMGTSHAFFLLFQHGHLFTFVVGGHHVLECPHCSQSVKTSIPNAVVLRESGHFTALTSHYRRKPCLIAAARKEQRATSTAIDEISSPAITRRHSVTPSPTIRTSSSDGLPSNRQLECHTSWSDTPLPLPVPPTPLLGNSCDSLQLPGSCLGLPFYWLTPPGTNIQMNVPWSRTFVGGPDELPFTINVVDGQVFARSPDCTRITCSNGLACSPCMGLDAKVHDLGETIASYKTRTRRSLLTVYQLQSLIDERNHELNRWKFKSLNDTRRIGRTLETLDMHSALVMALSQSDVPWLRHILQTLHKNGASIRTILRRIEDAIANGYRPHSYNQDELDLALLIYRVGGGNLLSALNQRLCLPTTRTLRPSTVKVTPTIGPISCASIAKNIQTVAIEPRLTAGLTALRGVSLLTDEISLEEAATYHPAENGVGGYCWKHAGNIYPFLDNYESAEQLATKLSAGDVHLGKEMTVVVAHCFTEDKTYPLLAAPSCKEEDHTDWQGLILKLVNKWYESGAHKKVGPLWSFATDGDATRRKAGHEVFMVTKLTSASPLYGILSGLPGLNLYTGPQEMTMDFDYKHIFKRICTALRSSRGILLDNGRLLTSKIFLRYFTWLDDVDEDQANKLLFPDDPQDVPRAIKLIHTIIRLAEIDPAGPPYTKHGEIPDVDAVIDFEAIKMLAQILHHFLEPFTNTALSLSQQVSYISTCSHLLFCQYRLNRASFLPNQLYYDIMTTMKNLIFCIAKQLWLDSSSKFSFLDVGTDQIEVLFALIRMCGGHNSAINYKQGIDRLRSACDISGVYSRNPDLHCGHRRLKLTRTEHVDHINRDMWQGDTVVRNCNLQTSWFDGRAAAISILSTSPLFPEEYDFDTIFSVEGVDLICVFGGGKYPSINQEDEGEDRSILLQVDSGETEAPPHLQVTNTRDEELRTTWAVEADEEPSLSFEDQLENEVDNGLVGEDFAGLSSPSFTDAGTNVTDDPSHPPPPSGKGIRPLDYLLYKGKWVHKASVCRLLLNKDFSAKSHDRLLRVRGFTPVNKLAKNSQPSILSDTNLSFVVGNPFITLIRLNDHTTSLALVRSTNISENGAMRNDVHIKTLQANGSNIKISGNILVLVPSELTPISESPDSEFNMTWIWTGSYLKAASPVPGLAITTQKVVEISTTGSLVELVNPSVVTASTHLTAENMKEINSRDLTWSLDNEALKMAVELIWKRMLEMKIPVSNIALLRVDATNGPFPYCSTDGSTPLVCEAATLQLSSSKGLAITVVCPRCNESTDDPRSHVGGHILRSIRGVEEVVVSPVDHLFPCGFCGRSQLQHPDCMIKVKITGRGVEMDTRCPYQVQIKFAYAEKGSKKRPCRNIPVVCPLCPLPPRSRQTDWRDGVWRYNMEQHLNFYHSEYAHPGKDAGLPLPSDVATATLLDPREEEACGVPIRPAFNNIVEKSTDAMSTREKRRHANANAFSTGATGGKRARHSK
ncbi:hypothetical protein PISMIDRAFT_690710 [Pisolithus microcarpus 441]|uniref:Uncharacterized protein n=1 Tax=Pisolithus microcarpus 441 TaxID=765257 RepID=A0A0C9YSE0_9AGAM|nr:hypothetical protein BKA83DRAFT_690710 [Pisolithus microcarpus]KIK10888.1 hypothetical protein PISMIDRAFT_690710 [Pisolithus microcarpus 441]